MQENWNERSLNELRAEAKARGLKGISAMRKNELIQLLSQNRASEEVPKSSAQGTRRDESRGQREEKRPRRDESRPQNLRSRTVRDNRREERRDSRSEQPRRNPMNNNVEQPRRSPMNNNVEQPRRSPMNNNVEQPRRTPVNTRRESQEAVYMDGWNTGTRSDGMSMEELWKLDSGVQAHGILEVTSEGYGFIRSENFLTGDNDVYVSHAQIRRFHMKTGDMITGNIRVKTGNEKNAALLYITDINGEHPSAAEHRKNFEDLTPIFPDERIHLESAGGSLTMRIVDLMCPIGKGQRGMIVSPPKAGKTTLMKDIAGAVKKNHPEMHIIILLIDERPEEVTDIRESIEGDNVEVIYSTFDEMPEHHRQVSEMVLGRAKRLVEHGRDVIILLDSITRLTRAYNLSVTPSGRTLSGGLDPAALYMPKKFFGAARNMREGGSLTILATALVDTGSRMDDVVFEEFKGTGNMEVVLDRRLSERRIFPAIDIQKSGTRRDDLLLTEEEKQGIDTIRRGLSGMKSDDAVEQVLNLFTRTKNNREFIELAKKIRL